MGLKSRRKGKRGEREIVVLARTHGLQAERTWHTAQASDPTVRRCDVRVAGRPAQVKVAANGFKSLYDALEDVEMAFLRADRCPWLAVLPAESLMALLARGGEGWEGQGKDKGTIGVEDGVGRMRGPSLRCARCGSPYEFIRQRRAQTKLV